MSMSRDYIATLLLLISLVGCREQTYIEKSRMTQGNNTKDYSTNRICCTTTSGAFRVLGHNIPESVDHPQSRYPAGGFSIVFSNDDPLILPGRLPRGVYEGVVTFYNDGTLKNYRLKPVK